MTIEQLSPKSIWSIFKKITEIPRASGNEAEVKRYIKSFAQANKITYVEDAAGNVCISKPATEGCEFAPTVTMQAHLDMVCEKNSSVEFNFDTDPINTIIDGDWVRADGTTLGGDNGIGVAAALAAFIEPNIKHGAMEALFTVEEETGLTGALQLNEDMLKGSYLINLDSEEEGEIYVGCAGGIGTVGTFTYKTELVPDDSLYLKINIMGLQGGHSGGDIHLGRGNSIKITARMLCQLFDKYNMQLCTIKGGNLHNAIPREAEVIVAIPRKNREDITIDLNIFAAEVTTELAATDSNLRIVWETIYPNMEAIETSISKRVINTLNAMPHGVLSMSRELEDLVETSTNLASITMPGNNQIVITTSQRSSNEWKKGAIASTIKSLFTLAECDVVQDDDYPGWQPNLNSKLLDITKTVYNRVFTHKKAGVKAIHAGLECGLIISKYPKMEVVSFGPTIIDVHSPDERLEIPSVEKFYQHLIGVIEEIAQSR